MSEDMNDRERAHVQAAYEAGVESITPQDLEKVMKDSATVEAKGGRLGKQFENFKLLWSLLKDYWNKNYPHAPWKLIAAIVFAVVYLVSPLDVIPDAIPLLGFIRRKSHRTGKRNGALSNEPSAPIRRNWWLSERLVWTITTTPPIKRSSTKHSACSWSWRRN